MRENIAASVARDVSIKFKNSYVNAHIDSAGFVINSTYTLVMDNGTWAQVQENNSNLDVFVAAISPSCFISITDKPVMGV